MELMSSPWILYKLIENTVKKSKNNRDICTGTDTGHILKYRIIKQETRRQVPSLHEVLKVA